ncbi:MAG: HNH endonuclease [Phycisphaerae bacterium]
MIEQLAMPTREQIGQALLRRLLKHGGVIKEFGAGETIVDEIAAEFDLNDRQRLAFLETVYRKENRVKKSSLWHRLLFRAADTLAREKLVSRPTETYRLTKQREWMLTEKGFDEALYLCNIPATRKDSLPVKSFEVQKIAKTIVELPKPRNYYPIETGKKVAKKTGESVLRGRGFRQAVVEAYNFKCAVCGLKIISPDTLSWEVEAAHIVPNYAKGRDDIWNGIAFCRLHHWAFDVGWFTILEDYQVQVSERINSLPPEYGIIGNYEFIRTLARNPTKLSLPNREGVHPDHEAVRWHRQHVFNWQCPQ